MRPAPLFSALSLLISVVLPTGAGWARPAPDSIQVSTGTAARTDRAPDLELSRRFLPPRYRIADPQARSRVRTWFLGRGDSSQYSFKGNILRLNGDGLRRLLADSATPGTPRERARRKLEQLAGSGVEEDPVYAAADYMPDDFSLQSIPQWGLRNDGSLGGSVPGLDIGMSKVWEKFDGDDSLVIAVLDAGINFYHPDLQGRWFVNQAEAKGLPGVDDDGNGFIDDSTGWDFVDNDNRPFDSHGHGTFLSGVIAAKFDNATGVAGMLPRVRILPVRVLGTTGSGNSSDIAAGMRYAAKMGAKVINFSIGINSTTLDTVLRNGFYVARDSGVIVAAASANDARNLDDPAQARAPSNYGLSNVYMVASHNQGGALSVFSNYGATKVDLAAPGENIVTTTIPAALTAAQETFEDTVKHWKFGSPSGTSFAVGTDTLSGTKSLKWVSGNSATALWDSLDLRGHTGGQVSFILEFKQGTVGANGDWVVVEAQEVGASATAWTSLATINGDVTGRTTIAFDLGFVDNKLFRLRFHNDFVGVSSTRVLHIDNVQIKYADENPAHQANYVITGGTSLAAPYVAAYAGLMRVACKRAGVPLTRERMLAGVAPDSFLVGKVATGGRLDAAKGLDFYLRTLPSLNTAENDSVWPAGNPVHYSLSVRDSLGQAVGGYAVASGPGTAGGSLSSNVYNWNQGSQTGAFTARFRAEKSPLVLRKQVRFTLTSGSTVLAGSGHSAPVLRIGAREFRLPAFALQGRSVTLRLETYGADGRTVQTLTGDLLVPAGAVRAEYRLAGFAGVGVRAWIDGVPLRPARP